MDSYSIQSISNVFFSEVFDKIARKNVYYATEEDFLFNFNIGANILGVSRTRYALALLTKHFVKLVKDGDGAPLDVLLEIATDIVCYLFLIYAMRVEAITAPKERR